MTTSQLSVLATVGTATCWGAFFLAWFAGAIYNGSHAPSATTRSHFGSGGAIGLIVVLLLFRATSSTHWQSLEVNVAWVRVFGLAILAAATGFTLWARYVLGTMWSAAPTVKEEHELRNDGPYGITRHPIYTGMLSMLLGTMFLEGVGRWIVVLPVSILIVEAKIRVEERLMSTTFPDAYARYRQQVPQLVPGLRWRAHSTRVRK